MKSLTLTVLLALQVIAAQAASVTFTSQEYTTSALAGVGGSLDGPFNDSSPPSSLPLSSAASLNSGDDSATAIAIADNLFLSATTEAKSINDLVDATAVATFKGNFIPTAGLLSLMVDFESNSIGAEIFVTLAVGITTLLFNASFDVTTPINQAILVPTTTAGAVGILDITLISLADASVGTEAANTASVTFALNTVNAVPAPTVIVDLLLGLGLMAITRRKRGARASA